MNEHVCLCGFMGSGKSVVGQALAELLAYEFIDLDAEIERQEGRTIAQIFEKDGESYFRAMEVLIGTPLFDRKRTVLALGGGALMSPELSGLAAQKSFLVYLEVADAWTLYDRMHGRTDRPLLAGVETYEAFEGLYRRLMSRRRPGYERARLTVSTDHKSVKQIADRIAGALAGGAKRGAR